MNTSATKKIALVTLTAPALAAVAVALAGAAAASPSSGMGSAQQTVAQLQDQGYHVVVNTNGSAPLDQCTVRAVRRDPTVTTSKHVAHAGATAPALYTTVYVDAYCRSVN